ncbi:threonylcarbamoyl-AMP synthase [Pontibacillus yanchengensis]|uniref:Threonylcarbamoyl-AMP synthase n=1 Tax=Pontibacillus yanchengensis TaxID=462910 RepID=A0ACC7VI09_9BACI|nr:L-threonylcarbamoyladenylate synthase [Pontibacillus yanchengensis]MYL54608.1 threonylcarbamoyl-AMP synthase [Pontibacillus yanchengensis]
MGTYETKFWNVDEHHMDHSNEYILEAASLLKKQEVVAFPTETVYGLGADATSETAVERIFAAKGRPADNSLIVHLANKEQIKEVVEEIPDLAHPLIERFLPGPLTLIFKSNGSCARNVTAGLPTVAVRIPDHPVAKALLEACGLPLAAPSANRSGRPSPTSAQHVYKDLYGRVAGIVDGGATGVGLESTVLDCTGEVPVILRPGGVTKQDLEAVIGDVEVDSALDNDQSQPKSPGMKYTHYAPEAPLWLIEGNLSFFQHQIDEQQRNGKRVGVIASEEHASSLSADQVQTCGSMQDLRQVAEQLYHSLRVFDPEKIDVILCETFPKEGMGEAVMNRLSKAATQKISQP